jgi:hypothetical protein
MRDGEEDDEEQPLIREQNELYRLAAQGAPKALPQPTQPELTAIPAKRLARDETGEFASVGPRNGPHALEEMLRFASLGVCESLEMASQDLVHPIPQGIRKPPHWMARTQHLGQDPLPAQALKQAELLTREFLARGLDNPFSHDCLIGRRARGASGLRQQPLPVHVPKERRLRGPIERPHDYEGVGRLGRIGPRHEPPEPHAACAIGR